MILYLLGAIVSFILSFFVHKYFIQLIVLGVVLFVLYILNSNKKEIDGLKKIIQEHNDLINQDIAELKKSERN